MTHKSVRGRINTPTPVQDTKKRKVTLLINEKTVTEAHDLGLNISKTCENLLKDFIATIKEAKTVKQGFLAPDSFTKEAGWCGRRDLNPGRQRGSVIHGDLSKIVINWGDYAEFLSKNHCLQNTKDLVSDAQRYASYLLNNNFEAIQGFSDCKRANALKALANLSKYLGCYDEFQQQRKAYSLSWIGTAKDDIIINRLLKTQNSNDIFTWMLDAKYSRPDLSTIIDFMATSGLRPGEAVNSYNLIIELSKQGLLYGKYLNPQTKFLEHFRFKNTFIRRSKKAFISYVPEKLICAIQDQEQIRSLDGIIKRMDNEGIRSRFSDIRELYASFMTQWLKPQEIDFLQGRVTAKIFMANYYNPLLIPGLVNRLTKGTTVILNKISGGEK